MNGFLQDLRYSIRMLRKRPGFSAVAILTLALGIGATTAIFSVVYGVLLRPLPYHQPDRLVDLREIGAHGNLMHFADPNFEDVRSQSRSLQGLAEYSFGISAVSGGAQPSLATVATVSKDFFPLMRVQPVLGRGFLPEDQRFGAAPVAMVSYGYWQQFLGGATDLSQRKLKIEDHAASVIGVLPPDFDFPSKSEIWVPRELYELLPSRTAHNWRVIGRLQDGVSIPQARTELSTIAQRLKQQFGQDTMMMNVSIMPLREALTRDVSPQLKILLGAVGFLLLIACANVANLLLAQSAARERELAIRAAVGAERGRLIRQFLTESLLLSLAGAVVGLLASFWGLRALLAAAPHALPRLDEVSINLPVLLFAIAVACLVAVGLGVFTAVRATSHDVQHFLESSRSGASRGGTQRAGSAIIAGQVAITLVLLVGAGLLGRSLLRVLSVDPGFRTEHILTMQLSLSSPDRDSDKVQRLQFLDHLFSRLGQVPGVEAVGGTSGLPLAHDLPDGTYILMNPGESVPGDMKALEQLFHDPKRTGDADYSSADGNYFRILGIPLVRGRLFNAGDIMSSPHVAVISQALAREKWPEQDPLGHQIEFGNMDGDLRPLTVVGVVGDVHTAALEHAPRPTIYVDYLQRPQAASDLTVVMRTAADPPSVITAARQILRELDPNVPPQFSTFDQVVSASLSDRRFNLLLVGIFAATALLLALAGIYGVTAYSVTRRTGEIGVRMALGATPGQVLRLIVRQGMFVILAGGIAGLLGSLALTRTLQSMLFGLTATDPLTLALVFVLLAVVALAACYIPARRAAEVDPMVALRYE